MHRFGRRRTLWIIAFSTVIQNGTKVLIGMVRKKELHGDESLWLLNTLSGLHSGGRLRPGEPCCTIEICLAILWVRPRDGSSTLPDLALLEAVLTLATISCTPDRIYRRETLVNSRQYPWLLLNRRSHELISRLLSTRPRCHSPSRFFSLSYTPSYPHIAKVRLISSVFWYHHSKG